MCIHFCSLSFGLAAIGAPNERYAYRVTDLSISGTSSSSLLTFSGPSGDEKDFEASWSFCSILLVVVGLHSFSTVAICCYCWCHLGYLGSQIFRSRSRHDTPRSWPNWWLWGRRQGARGIPGGPGSGCLKRPWRNFYGANLKSQDSQKHHENQWKSLKHTNKLWNKLNGILLGFRRRWTSHCSWRSQKFRLGRSSAAFNPTEIQSIPRDDLQPTGWELKVGWESWESWLCRLCNPHPIMVRIQR